MNPTPHDGDPFYNLSEQERSSTFAPLILRPSRLISCRPAQTRNASPMRTVSG